MMILLASITSVRRGEIPLTFLAVAMLYLGGEVYRSSTRTIGSRTSRTSSAVWSVPRSGSPPPAPHERNAGTRA